MDVTAASITELYHKKKKNKRNLCETKENPKGKRHLFFVVNKKKKARHGGVFLSRTCENERSQQVAKTQVPFQKKKKTEAEQQEQQKVGKKDNILQKKKKRHQAEHHSRSHKSNGAAVEGRTTRKRRARTGSIAPHTRCPLSSFAGWRTNSR